MIQKKEKEKTHLSKSKAYEAIIQPAKWSPKYESHGIEMAGEFNDNAETIYSQIV